LGNCDRAAVNRSNMCHSSFTGSKISAPGPGNALPNGRGNRPDRLPNRKSTVRTANRLPPARPGRLTPWLARLDYPVILVVRADPDPDEIVAVFDGQGSVSRVNPG